ncbi:MAG: LysR family transcriptional regulator [Pseudomonadota bacterium]
MDQRSLQCFVALAEELHFGRAGRRANISQPGLSGQIRRLEKRLGAKLFQRSTRSVSLTPSGNALLPHAKRALRSMELGNRSVQSLIERTGGHLVVAVTNICAQWGAYDLISGFSKRHPDISVETRELTSNLQEDGLARGTIDVGFLHPPLMDSVRFEHVGHDGFGVALPADHPLVHEPELHIAHLADEPLIVFPRENGPHLFSRIEDAFRCSRVAPVFSEFATPLTLSIRAAASGRGIALITESYARSLPANLVYRPVTDLDVQLPIAIGWHSECWNHAVEKFRTHCNSAANS